MLKYKLLYATKSQKYLYINLKKSNSCLNNELNSNEQGRPPVWGIIGGSGFEKFEGIKNIESLDRSTPFGPCSTGFQKMELDGIKFNFIPRHGKNHESTPSEVNYLANIFALKKQGSTKIIAFSAVGSLKKEFAPGDLVIPHQYIDRTKSLRKHTFCGDGFVGHTSLAKPICISLFEKFNTKSYDFKIHKGGVYICVEGPYFSTQAESKSYLQLGASIIGMTNFPEYALAREAGLHYIPCCFVTDYDCWDDSIPHVTLDEVILLMKKNNIKAFHILKNILKENPIGCSCENDGLKTGLMTHYESIDPKIREWLKIIR